MPKVETPIEPTPQTELPSILNPYISLGLDLDWDGSNHATSDCPWCNNQNGKFSINIENGMWRCWVCGEGSNDSGGNIYTFLNLLLNKSISETSIESLETLKKHRNLLSEESLLNWNVCRSSITGEWIVPAFNHEKRVVNLYRYSLMQALFSQKGLSHGLFGVPLLSSDEVFICEGPWDAIALYEVLKLKKADASVVAVPGCNVFEGIWYKLFSGKTVNVLFDNDHPKKEILDRNPDVEPGSFKGLKRLVSRLATSPKPPKQLNSIIWGEQGYDPNLKSGLDVRDILCEGIK